MHLISSIRYGEGEVIGVCLLFTGMDILNVAGGQVSLGKCANPCSCNRIKQCKTLQLPAAHHFIYRTWYQIIMLRSIATIKNIPQVNWNGWIKHAQQQKSHWVQSGQHWEGQEEKWKMIFTHDTLIEIYRVLRLYLNMMFRYETYYISSMQFRNISWQMWPAFINVLLCWTVHTALGLQTINIYYDLSGSSD